MLSRIDVFRVKNSRSYVGIYVENFSISSTYVSVLHFIVLCSIHADRKDTVDGNEKSFVLKRRGGRRWTIQTAYVPARTTRNGKLGFLCLFLSPAQSE